MQNGKIILAILLVSLGLFSLSFSGNESAATKPAKVQWMSIQEAIELNKTEPRKVIVDIYTDWCFWCKKMDEATFQHPEIVNYINDNFYAVKLDAQMQESVFFKENEYYFDTKDLGGFHEMAFYLTRGRLSFPSVVFLDELMNNPQPIAGFQRPVDMDKLLKFFGDNYYKQMDWYRFNLLYPELDNRLNAQPPNRLVIGGK